MSEHDGTRFHWADYLVFALVLALSSSLGIFYGIRDRNQKRVEDFLLAGRKMHFVPVSVSLFVTWMSAVSFLGDPVEVYQHGAVYSYLAIGYCLALPVVAEFIAPVYHRMKLTSVFEYLETRFHKSARICGSLVTVLGSAVFSGVVLYGPSVALAQVSGIDVWVSIVGVGLICTFYTTLGGMRAVLWADTMQTVIMFLGLLTLLVRGSVVLGGFSAVWSQAQQQGRVNFNKFNPNPLIRSTFWSYVVGGFFRVFNPYVSHQMWAQRYFSLRSVRHVKIALYLNVPLYAVFVTMFTMVGLLMTVYYKDCDPIKAGRVTRMDQMLPLMMVELLGVYPGVPGLFLACVFSASLSTLSSSQNALATIVLKDYIEPLHLTYKKDTMSQRHAIIIAKVLCVVFGVLSILMALVVLNLDNPSIFQVTLKVTGSTSGPLAAMFVLGIACHFVNTIAAMVGFLVSLAVCLWLSLGSMLSGVKTSEPLPVSTDGCLYLTNITHHNITDSYTSYTTMVDTSTISSQQESSVSSLDNFYRFSPVLYNVLGHLLALVGGVILGAAALLVNRKRQKYDVQSAAINKGSTADAFVAHKESSL